MGVLRVLGRTGDVETPYTKRDFARAKEEFDMQLEGGGLLAFTVDPNTGAGKEQIRKFDPEAEEIIMTKQLKGG